MPYLDEPKSILDLINEAMNAKFLARFKHSLMAIIVLEMITCI